jgi:hypothetical protein
MNATSTPTANPVTLDALDRKTTRVRVLMNAGILEGDHPHPPGVQLSESLRNAASHERYLLLTNVTIHHLDGTAAHGDLARAPFVLINTAQTHAIIPLEDQ